MPRQPTSPFTPQERELIRLELMPRFGQEPNLANGLFLRTWRDGLDKDCAPCSAPESFPGPRASYLPVLSVSYCRCEIVERASEVDDVVPWPLAEHIGQLARFGPILPEQDDAPVEVIFRQRQFLQASCSQLISGHVLCTRQAAFGELVRGSAIDEDRRLINLENPFDPAEFDLSGTAKCPPDRDT